MGSSEITYHRIAMPRAERGISRRQLADALGVHYQTVGYLERGEFSPSLHLALRICDYFEVPVEVVFSLKPFPRLGAAPAERSARGPNQCVRASSRPDPPAQATWPSGRNRRSSPGAVSTRPAAVA